MSLTELQAKLAKLEQDLDRTQQKVSEVLHNIEEPAKSDHVYCYFNHSLLVEHEKNASRLIMGSFHIKNTSNKKMDKPIILIKISSENKFNFSGKFQTDQQKQSGNFQWKRVHLQNLDPATHFCLKPTNKDYLAPHELLSFQNFQIKIPLHASILAEGFVYFEESNDGVPSVNSINIGL